MLLLSQSTADFDYAASSAGKISSAVMASTGILLNRFKSGGALRQCHRWRICVPVRYSDSSGAIQLVVCIERSFSVVRRLHHNTITAMLARQRIIEILRPFPQLDQTSTTSQTIAAELPVMATISDGVMASRLCPGVPEFERPI
jgi:hypothetical protein